MNKIEVTIEELRKYSLFVGLPMYGGKCEGLFCKSTNELSQLCAQYGIELKFYYLMNESLIQRARNYIVDEFLRSNCTHFMFIDADIQFNAVDVLSLFALSIKHPELYDVLVAPYPKKTIAWEKIQAAVESKKVNDPFELRKYGSDFVFNLDHNQTTFKINDIVPVLEAGTGFMLIPRSVFERYKEKYPENSYLPDHTRTEQFDGSREIMAYFDCKIDPITKRYMSEDYYFCRNCINIDIKLHMCPWISLNHIGSYVYEGSLPHLAQLNVTPTADKTSNKKFYKK